MNGRTNSSDVTIEEINHGALIPLEVPTNLQLVPLDKKATIRWEDPVDKYAEPGGELVSQWAYSILVRKESSAPTSPEDGVLVLKTTTRNQYSSDVYTDDGNLDNTKLYYYAVYAYNTYDVPSDPVISSVQPRDAIIEYYGTAASNLSLGRRDARGIGIGKYALIGGGRTDSSYSSAVSNVDAYDSSSLTKVASVSGLYSAFNMMTAKTSTHAFFAGGVNSSNNPVGSAKAYDEDLTVTSLTNVNSDGGLLGASSGEYAIFPPASNGQSFRFFNYSLTQSTVSSSSGKYGYSVGISFKDDAIFFHRQGISKLNSSLTEIFTSVNFSSDTYPYEPAASTINHIIMQRGSYRRYEYGWNESSARYEADYQAFDASLTRKNLATISGDVPDRGGSLSVYALFGGGYYCWGTDSRQDQAADGVYSFNASLTRSTLPNMSTQRKGAGVASAGDYIFFAGGEGARSPGMSSSSMENKPTVDVYVLR